MVILTYYTDLDVLNTHMSQYRSVPGVLNVELSDNPAPYVLGLRITTEDILSPESERAMDAIRQESTRRYQLPAPFRPNRYGIPDDVQSSIISQYLESSSGRSNLAGAMVSGFYRRRDYQSIARRTFIVDPLYTTEPEPLFPSRNQPLPDWVAPGVYMQSTDPEGPGIVKVTRADDTEVLWTKGTTEGVWRKTDGWFHDDWQWWDDQSLNVWDHLHSYSEKRHLSSSGGKEPSTSHTVEPFLWFE